MCKYPSIICRQIFSVSSQLLGFLTVRNLGREFLRLQASWWITVLGLWRTVAFCVRQGWWRLQSEAGSLMWGVRRSVWVFGQEPGQTGAESDGVITLHAALLSALAWMPLFIHPKRHIIGQSRVGYPGHWPQSWGQGEQGGRWKEA